MTKQELLENYTMEQIAEMVIKYQEMARQIILNENVSNTDMFKNKSSVAYEAELSEHKAEINRLKSELDRKETTINQIDDILNELFGVTHDAVSKPDEFKEILKEKIEGSKTIADFLPAEPIKVADILISEKGEYERNAIGKPFYENEKGTYNLFDVSELRQIAEHLFVYCNANESGD